MAADQNSSAESKIFNSFVSLIKNQSTGILKIQSGKTFLRQFAFAQGNCVDVSTNIKEELPGSFLFQKKLLTTEQYQSYLENCSKPKTNQWALANLEAQIAGDTLTSQRREHFKKIVNDLQLSQVTGVSFTKLASLPHDKPIIANIELILLLVSKLTSEKVQALKPEFNDPETRLSIIHDLPKKVLNEDQEGLFTVIQHNHTLHEVLDSSFLDRDKIFQFILSFEAAGLIRLESAHESEKRKFLGSLDEDRKKNRQDVKNEYQKMSSANFYEFLGLHTDADAEDILQGYTKLQSQFLSPAYENLYYAGEEDLLKVVLEKIDNAYATLSDAQKKKEYDQFISKGSSGNFMDQSQTIQEEKLLEEFNSILKSRKFNEALEFLQDKITQYPSFIKLYASLVQLVKELKLTNNEDLNKHLFALFKNGIAKNPKEAELFTLLGEWCLFLEQKNNALKAFQKALNLKPSSAKLRKYLLELDRDQGKQIIVEALFQNLESLNHFEILGLQPTSQEEEIREAYREASRHFHPDLFFSNKNENLKEMDKKVFKEIIASHLILRDEEKRKPYLEHLFSSQRKKDEKQRAVVPKSIQSKKYYDQAVKFIQSQNFPSAKLNIQLALSYEPENYLLQKMLREVQTKLV